MKSRSIRALKKIIKKTCNNRIVRIFRIHTKTSLTKNFAVCLFNHAIFYIQIVRFCPKIYVPKIDKNSKKIIYLKINRYDGYTLMCIQNWLNTVELLNSDYFFVCDNDRLKVDVLRFLHFKDENIKFMCSKRFALRHTAENLTGKLTNVLLAHLTPFYHAKAHNITKHWDIDADDTMFCIDPKKTAEILAAVEKEAEVQNIAAFSLDMWRTRTNGKHWSLGILFINDCIDFCSIFDSAADFSWIHRWYSDYADQINLDWYFSYLKDVRQLNIQTFYVENCYFIHFGNLLRQPIYSSIYLWRDDSLIFPILRYIYCNERLGCLKIADCKKINVSIDFSDSLSFFENEICAMKYVPIQNRQLYQMQDFCTKTNSKK